MGHVLLIIPTREARKAIFSHYIPTREARMGHIPYICLPG